MTNSAKMRVKDMPRASLLEDGSLVQLEFRAEDGRLTTLEFDPGRLDSFVSRTLQLTHEARIRKAATAGHLSVQPYRVVAALAQEAVGGKAVILQFRTDNGQIYAFSTSPDEANQLRNEMTKAIASARKQARQTRQ